MPKEKLLGNTHEKKYRGLVALRIGYAPMLTVEQVAEILALHPKTIRECCTRGELPAIKIGRIWRINRDKFFHQFGIKEGRQ